MEGGPPMFNPGFTSPDLLKGCGASSSYRAFTFFGRAFQRVHRTSTYPLSLAATYGVAVAFLSSGYLDVSVSRVRFDCLCIQQPMTLTGRVSPFRNPKITA